MNGAQKLLVVALVAVSVAAAASGIALGSSSGDSGALTVADQVTADGVTLEIKDPPSAPPPPDVEYAPNAATVVSPDSAEYRALGLNPDDRNVRICKMNEGGYVVMAARTSSPSVDPFPDQDPSAKAWQRPC